MDGGSVKDLLSLRHIFSTLREIIFDPERFAERVREEGFSGITRPIPFVTACLLVHSIVYRHQNKSSPLSSLTTTDQIEFFLLLFLPFAAVYHFFTKDVVGTTSTPLSVGISGWLYVGGIVSLVTALLVGVNGAVTGFPFLPTVLLFLSVSTVILLTCTIMRHLYEARNMSEVRSSIYPAAKVAFLLFFFRDSIYKFVGFNPAAWLATQLETFLH